MLRLLRIIGGITLLLASVAGIYGCNTHLQEQSGAAFWSGIMIIAGSGLGFELVRRGFLDENDD